MDFKEFMDEEKLLNRWTVMKAGLFGAFCGAILMLIFALLGIVG